MRGKRCWRVVAMILAASNCVSEGLAARQAEEPPDPAAITINLSLSGGGFRASAFAYGIMLELDKIGLCWGPDEEEGKSRRISSVLKDVTYATALAGHNPNPDMKCQRTTTLLDRIHVISSVSGGSFTGAYYMTHGISDFKSKFRDKLLAINPTADLFGRIKTRSILPQVADPLFRPVLLLTSVLDTLKYFITLPFQIFPFPGLSEVPNPDFTPAVFLGAGQGLISPDEYSQVIGKWFFEDRRHLTLGALKKPALPSASLAAEKKLIINAGDLSNQYGFAFDETSFRCWGLTKEQFERFPLELALATSAAIPVLVAPYQFPVPPEESRPDRVGPKECNPPLFSRAVPPALVDGGVVDNLGLEKLVSDALSEKRSMVGDVDGPGKKFFMISVNSSVRGGGGLSTLWGKPSLSQDIDRASDVLMGHKTDVTRTIYETSLATFGFGFVELSFPDLEHDNELLKLIDRVSPQHGRQNGGTARQLSEANESAALHRQNAEKLLEQVQKIGMRPTAEEIDLVIAAGRAVVMKNFQELRQGLLKLSRQTFKSACSLVLNPDKEFCFPRDLNSWGQSRESTRLVLKTFDRAKEEFIKKTTERRASIISLVKGRLQNIFATELGMRFRSRRQGPIDLRLVEDVLCKRVPTVDVGYYFYSGKEGERNEVEEYSNRCVDAVRKGMDLSPKNWTKMPQFGQAVVADSVRPAAFLTDYEEFQRQYDHERCQKTDGKCSKGGNEHENDNIIAHFESSFGQCKGKDERGQNNEIAWCFRLLGTLHLAAMDSDDGSVSKRPSMHSVRALQYFEEGLDRFPEEMYLNAWYGYALIGVRHAFTAGLGHLKHALDIIKNRQDQLSRVEEKRRLQQMMVWDSATEKPDEKRSFDFKKVVAMHKEHERLYKYRYSKLVTLSPAVVPDSESTVIESDVEEWLQRAYPDIEFNSHEAFGGKNGSNLVEMRNVCEELEKLARRSKDELTCSRAGEAKPENSEAVLDEVKKLVRVLLADNAGSVRARRYASELYEERGSFSEHVPKPLIVPAENLATMLMVDHAVQECPQRGPAVEQALKYLMQADDYLKSAYSKDVQDSEFRETGLKLLYDSASFKIERKIDLATRLQCWGFGHDGKNVSP